MRHQLETCVLSTVHHQSIVESPSSLPRHLLLEWPDEAATQRFAEALAAWPGIANAVITLQGPLGTGKTTFVRYLLRALGVQGRIKSPTYAVVEPYELVHAGAPLAISHFDFYRFTDPREWEDAGFRDIFASPGLKIAEWPDLAGALLPLPDLAIQLTPMDETRRQVQLTTHTAAGATLLAQWPQERAA
ncbi:tRNA (adenosine(37)-N6)-threonylcarbamoyltransferase complex ATPase subunit type 1 TsaE [Variovorax sp. HJSM1_2]|uniref:tRNA (adenosine(37)-N6)-threonylcarbamoyltransferase complex ATPase subunit type 1 TsaE n=1 Tax=Variovorax sp. HJSM1_2 TaxID=3366263 RepID=UPI003BBBCC02